MAGTDNIFNAAAEEVLYEAIVRANGLTMRRDEVEVTIVSQTPQTTRVRLTPREVLGTTLYVDPVEVTVRKLNLAGKMPKDMSYSGFFPLTFESLVAFLGTSYGLVIRPREWLFRRNGTEVLVDEAFHSNGDLVSGREFYLRPSNEHPLFEAGSFELPVLITEPMVASS